MKSSVKIALEKENTAGRRFESREINESKFDYLRSFIDSSTPAMTIIGEHPLSGQNHKDVYNFKNIFSLKSLNYISSPNEFIKKINKMLPEGGIWAGKFRPEEIRKQAIRRSCESPYLFYPVYFTDYFARKISFKFKLTRRLYKKLTHDQTNILAFGEALGRVAAGGFKILDYKQFGEFTYFVAQKVGKPAFNESDSHGPIFKMKRIGEGGKIREFYKFRTMHVFADQLQNFVYQRNGLENGDKLRNDYRITDVGYFLRKYWLDELPMVMNMLKGDLKLVGVRPLSNQKFNLYSKDLQEYRTKFKPGLIPPFYADMPESLDELMASEIRYLRSYEKAPLITDIKYLFKALYNIFIEGARSR